METKRLFSSSSGKFVALTTYGLNQLKRESKASPQPMMSLDPIFSLNSHRSRAAQWVRFPQYGDMFHARKDSKGVADWVSVKRWKRGRGVEFFGSSPPSRARFPRHWSTPVHRKSSNWTTLHGSQIDEELWISQPNYPAFCPEWGYSCDETPDGAA